MQVELAGRGGAGGRGTQQWKKLVVLVLVAAVLQVDCAGGGPVVVC